MVSSSLNIRCCLLSQNKVLTKSLSQTGPIVRTGPSRVDICDISAVKEIHRTNSRFLKSDWYRKLVANGFETMFTTTDPHFHSARRRLLASPISDSSLTRMEPIILSRVHMAIDRITEEMEKRGAADVFKWWLFMATDVIGELSFGESFRMLEAGEVISPAINKILEEGS